jgi:alkylhydroperoxidase family enzyme
MPGSYDKRAAQREIVGHILEAQGKTSPALRRAAFDNKGLEAPLDAFINKLATQPARVTDEDVGAARAFGLSEDQIFELVICAAVGQSSRQYESALKALDQARNEGGGGHAS